MLIIFPELDAEEKALDARQKEVDAMRAIADKVRTEEQLNDRQRLLRSIRFTCRMALCCLAARPRTWKQWEIMKAESSVWKRATDENHRVVKTLFGGDKPAIRAMNTLALEVIRLEEAEISARLASPENAANAAVTSAVYQIGKEAAADRAKMQAVLDALMTVQSGSGVAAPLVLPPPLAEAPPDAAPAASAAITTASMGTRIKHKRKSQDDVAHFSSWPDLGLALTYAKEELTPREKTEGAKWRIIQREDDREDKSRDKQWRCYRSVAIAVGILMRGGKSYEDAVGAVQERFERLGVQSHTPFLKAINEEIKQMQKSDADVLARKVLGF